MGLVDGFRALLDLPKKLPVSQTDLDTHPLPSSVGPELVQMEGQDWGVPEFSLAGRKEKVGKGIESEGIASAQQRSLRGVRPWKVGLAESAKGSTLHSEAMIGPPHPVSRTLPSPVWSI